jgi:ubiquinone/menaquinone biosynthesis C-methylase UbiE
VTSIGRGFDSVADLYDEVRPHYPDELYDAIDSVVALDGAAVLDLAAGTGIATRVLQSRGARVVALEPGEPMLRRLYAISPRTSCVVARAEQIPLRDDSFDLVTCATAWHWVDPSATVSQLRRVLRPAGHLALWWANNRWDDGIDWEVAQSGVYDRWQTDRGSRPAEQPGVRPLAAAGDLR